MNPQFCPQCNTLLAPTNYFCPNCGHKIKETPLSTGIGKQIGIYLLSFFLPPLGLWPGIKYLKRTDSKAQIVGMIAILLTLLSIFISIFLTVQILNSVSSSLNTQLEGTGLEL